jgi:cell division protein FtsX
MPDKLTITLPGSISAADIAEITQALKEIQAVESVKDTRSPVQRGVDPATLKVWVEIAVGVVGFVSAAMPLIKKVIATIRGKGISGAKIKLPNGTEISVDNASHEEIEKILKAMEKK